MDGPLLTLSVRSHSQLDTDVEENRDQAAYEFRRAVDQGNAADLAAWARRWGPGFSGGHGRELEAQIADLEDEVSDLKKDLETGPDTTEVEDSLDEVQGCLETAIERLAEVAGATDALAQLADAQSYISKARKGLDNL